MRVLAVHLWVLGAFAVAQPVFAVLRDSPSFFIARRVDPPEMVLFALGLIVIPALLPILLVAGAERIRRGWGFRVAVALAGVLGALIALPLLSGRLGLKWWGVAPAAVVGLVVWLVYARIPRFRELLTIAVPVPLVFAGLFLLTPPLSDLVLPAEAEAVAASGGAARAPVVFVIFDEFPATSILRGDGSLHSERFPNLQRLADTSTWYPDAVTASASTFKAIPSLLTGKEPVDGALPTVADHPENLFTLLRGIYDLEVTETFTHLCPSESCASEIVATPSAPERLVGLLATSARLYPRILMPHLHATEAEGAADPLGEFLNLPGGLAPLEGGPEDRGEFSEARREALEREAGRSQAEVFRRFIDTIRPGERRLHFLHIYLPHPPFRYFPSGATYHFPPIPGVDGSTWVEPALTLQGYQRHLVQARYTDSLIGELLDHLETQRMFDDTLLVLTSDHGTAFRVGEGRRTVVSENTYDISLVPLFIKAPGQREGRVHASPVGGTDVLPTIAELLGIDIPWEVDGVAVIGEGPARRSFEVANFGDRWFTIDDPTVGRLAGAERLAGLFGDGDGPFDLFAFGPHSDVVGVDAATLEAGPPDGVAWVKSLDAFETVDLASNLPAYVEGAVDGISAGDHVALVLNGKVATVVPVYAVEGSRGEFSALLPDHLFRGGDNRFEVLVVGGSGAGRTFRGVELRNVP